MKDTTPKYRAILIMKSSTTRISRIPWDCKSYGRPTEKNAQRFIENFNASLQPGGANEHLAGTGMEAVGVRIETNCREPETIAKAGSIRS